MKQVTQHNKSGEVRVEQVPLPALRPGFVLVKTRFSLISTGSEKASVNQRRGSLLKRARSQPELLRNVLGQMQQYGLIATVRRARGRLISWVPIGCSLWWAS